MFLLLTLEHISHLFLLPSIVDFEQVDVSWEALWRHKWVNKQLQYTAQYLTK